MYQEFLNQITEFVFPEDELQKADIIFIPGNRYPHMAEKAAKLWHQGYAPYIMPSGKWSILEERFEGVLEKKDKYRGAYQSEWEFLKDVLVKNNVPEEVILQEDQASYTYENAVFSRRAADCAGVKIRSAIICARNYHARRCLMYYQRLFPEAQIQVCPVQIGEIEKEHWMYTEEGIEAVTGEMRRIIQQFSIMLK